LSDFDTTDYFRSESLVADPYPYFDYLRSRCPVQREPHKGVMMVTGYDQALAVYRDVQTFSSCNSVTGPFPGFPVPLEGDDISMLIEEHRDGLPFSDQLPTLDPPTHTMHRGLLLRLLTPKRMKENEEAMWRLADRQIDEFVARGACEFIGEFAAPFTLFVIADLLGVPDADLPAFREQFMGTTSGLGDAEAAMTHTPLEYLYEKFASYIEERRRHPRQDVLTRMAEATFPDDSTPEVADVVRVAANLFAAGQETTVRLLGAAMQIIGEDGDLQQLLRDEPDRIPNFIEETLRFESPVKGDFRLARVPTTVGGVDIPAGTTVMVLNGAANRDPRHFERPAEFLVDRPNAREHLSFGHGIHFCAGAPLARAEGRIAIERMLDRVAGIRISEAAHGPSGRRSYKYVPTFILRGLQGLHIEFTPRAG
jgi:cytochrome P450 family 150 subfamily A5